jgi:hypothetical protein
MKRLILIFLLLAISGCQKSTYIKPDPSLNETNAARVIVYRPKSDWMGIAINYKAYAGEVELGSLSPGGYVDAFVPAGISTIKVQGHFLGIADGKPGKQELMLNDGGVYYLRFTQRLDGMVIIGNGSVAYGGLSLVVVEEADYKILR